MPTLGGVVVAIMVITAYCACPICTAPYSDGITASGAKVTEGRTVAAGPSVPFGTALFIQGLGRREVEDRGGAIKDGHVDVYFDSHRDALNFGVRTLLVWREIE